MSNKELWNCNKSRGLQVETHDSIRNIVLTLLYSAGYTATLEETFQYPQLSIQGDINQYKSKDRLDISIPNGLKHNGLKDVIDIRLTTAERSSNTFQNSLIPLRAAALSENEKCRRYDSETSSANQFANVIPFVIEIQGAYGKIANETLQIIFSNYAHISNISKQSLESFWRNLLSIKLQQAVSTVINKKLKFIQQQQQTTEQNISDSIEIWEQRYLSSRKQNQNETQDLIPSLPDIEDHAIFNSICVTHNFYKGIFLIAHIIILLLYNKYKFIKIEFILV